MSTELQGRVRYVKLYSGINTNIYINDRTSLCMFCNNPCLLHECAVRCITKYLTSTSTYVDLPDRNRRLTTRGLSYRPDIEKFIDCYIGADFSDGWAQSDADNAETFISLTGYVISYVVCPVIWCSKLQP